MTLSLGIDTGGTYTDAALVDHESGAILAGAKALTTYHDLSIGIGQAIQNVFARRNHTVRPADIDMVALSTTLATNAIVEERGSPVCLLLIGYDPDLLREFGFEAELATEDIVYIAGGHDISGNEKEPLDEDALREAILARRDHVESVAISGYFSVRNPAHELQARELVESLTRRSNGFGLAATCGHELTTRLNAVQRATTTVLNARLIPLLQELIATVRQTLAETGISAPLMVVKGDGSLARAEWAMQRPIETILSGPAASVVGAWHLAGRRDGWVVDMGGTTTDIARLAGGLPSVNQPGARVGRWQTMVEAVDVHTLGLGGDSQVRLAGKAAAGKLLIGPRRVAPLSLLASQHPAIIAELKRQLVETPEDDLAGQFVIAHRRPRHHLEAKDWALLERLAAGPKSVLELLPSGPGGFRLLRQIEQLTARRLLLLAGFTPTDALHVQGDLVQWDGDAAWLGARLLAGQMRTTPESLAGQVIDGVSDRVATALVGAALNGQAGANWQNEPIAHTLLNQALSRAAEAELDCQLTLRQPLIAIGAPVEAYLPRTARQLHTELTIPPHAEVANAIGAVSSSVVQRRSVLIQMLDESEEAFRAYLPDRIEDFPSLEEAVSQAQAITEAYLTRLAEQAGAGQVELRCVREDRIVPLRDDAGHKIYLGTVLAFTAVGRPGLRNGE